METLLRVEDLEVRYSSRKSPSAHVLRHLNIEIARGEALGILGESGCGKTTLARSLLGVLPKSAEVSAQRLQFQDRDLLQLSNHEWQRIRGAQVALIFQDPNLSLHPFLRVGAQMEEVLRAHSSSSNRYDRRKLAENCLSKAGLREISRICSSYPHQLSGGEKQRVMIAQAIACRPSLIVADEPTSALDASLQDGILELLKSLCRHEQIALLLISHDPSVLAHVTDRIAVMYAGTVVEEGATKDVLASPLHPFTRGLLRCMPAPGEGKRLPTLAGAPPEPTESPMGCAFAARCPDRMHECDAAPPGTSQPRPNHQVRCFKYNV